MHLFLRCASVSSIATRKSHLRDGKWPDAALPKSRVSIPLGSGHGMEKARMQNISNIQ